MSLLSGRRVLVTGGTGFIGGRAVEKLVLEHDAKVRVLTSNYAGASRVGRFDVELVRGDVTDRSLMLNAAEGCDTIIHCAYGSRGSDAVRRQVNVEGTRAVLDAALATGARRVVHVSTMVVYGIGIEGLLDERAPTRRTGVSYADTKREAEILAFEYVRRHGAPVTVIQPTAVYGPNAPSWTERVIQAMKTGLIPLVDGGGGLANPVYIDDLADAMLLAATRDEAVGEAFLIASGERVTWRDFYGRYEAMLGMDATIDMSQAEAKALYARSQVRRPWLAADLLTLLREDVALRRRLFKTRELATVARLLGPARRPLASLFRPRGNQRINGLAKSGTGTTEQVGRRPQPVHPKQVDFLAAKTDVSIEKARRLIGYQPGFDLDAGMSLTESWARWAGLLPSAAVGRP